MKIKVKTLLSFVKKASLDGHIMTINIDFKETGVLSSVIDATKISVTRVNMKKEAFEEYKAIGQIFIKDSTSFMSYLKTFSDVITLEIVERYILKITGKNREGYVTLGSELVCDNVYSKELPIVPDTQSISLNVDDFKAVKNDMNLLGMGQVVLTAKENVLEVQVGQKGESDYFVNIINLKDKQIEKKCVVGINKSLIMFLNSIEDNFEMRIGTDVPLTLKEKTELMDYTCIIAPLIETE